MNRFEDAARKITGYSWLDELARKSLASAEKRFAPTRPVIPAEAVEAAARAFIEHGTLLPALEAAAPHMLADAWEQGRLVGRAEEQSGFDTEMNPYGDPYMLNNEALTRPKPSGN